MYSINYVGLKKKETYDELIDYVMNEQEKIKYPDRRAIFLRNSPQLSNLLDGDGEGLLEMEEQQKKQVQEEIKGHTIREMAGPNVGSTTELRAGNSGMVGEPVRVVPRPAFLNIFSKTSRPPSDYESISEYASMPVDSDNEPNVGEDFRDDISDELDELNRAEREQGDIERERKLMLGEDLENMLKNIKKHLA